MKKETLIGTWKFLSVKAVTPKGEAIYPYGETLFGMLIYTTSGHVSVLLMDPDRQKFASDDPFGGTPEEIKEAYEGFDAYCGPYTLDEEKGIITHHLMGSKFPNWVGSDQVRHIQFSGDRMEITADIPVKGEQWHFEAILKRL